jgi:hypothetical protein
MLLIPNIVNAQVMFHFSSDSPWILYIHKQIQIVIRNEFISSDVHELKPC